MLGVTILSRRTPSDLLRHRHSRRCDSSRIQAPNAKRWRKYKQSRLHCSTQRRSEQCAVENYALSCFTKHIYSYFVRHLVQRLTMQILNRIEVMMVDAQKGSEKRIGKWPIKEAIQQFLTRMEAYDNQLRQIFKEAGTPVKCTVSATCSIGSWRRNCCARGWPIGTWRPYLMDQASHY